MSKEDNVAPGESLAAKEGVHFTEHAVRNCWKFLNRCKSMSGEDECMNGFQYELETDSWQIM